MRRPNKSAAYAASAFEWAFWLLAGVPLCGLTAEKAAYIFGSVFPPYSDLFWFLGLFCMAGCIFLCIVKRPLSCFFSRRWLPYIVSGVLFAGVIVGLRFGGMLAFFERPYEDFAFYGLICKIGVGLLLILFISLFIKAVAVLVQHREHRAAVQGSRSALWFVVVAALLVVMVFITNSHELYYWDNVIYYSLSRILEAEITARPWSVLEQVYYTIQTWDYNYLGALLPAIFMHIFGMSRHTFLLLNTIIYLLTALFALYLVHCKISAPLGNVRSFKLIFVGLVLWLPLLLVLTLNGSVDVGGVGLMLLCIYLYFDEDKPLAARYILCGTLLALLVLFRRWYMFWSAAFLISAAVDRLVRIILEKGHIWGRVKEYLLRMSLLFGGFGGLFVFFFDRMLVDKYLLTNVTDAYQAFDMGMGQNMRMFASYFGVVLLFLTAAAVIYNLFHKKTVGFTLFLLVQAAVCFGLLSIVQSHDIQHLLLYVPLIFCMLDCGIVTLCVNMKKAWVRNLVCVALIAAAALNFSNTLHTRNKLPGFTYCDLTPQRSENIDEMLRLLYCLDDEVERTGGKVVVLSASDLLNAEMLSYAELSLGLSDCKRDYFSFYALADRRDGFSEDIFEADTIVVPTKKQVYLGEENMRVLAVPTQYFYEQKGFANAFERLERAYWIGGDTYAHVYRKTRDITEAEKTQLRRELASYYPDLPALFPEE